MNVSLTKKLEKWVRKQVAAGEHDNASEVVRHALSLAIQYDEQLTQLRKDINVGIEDVRAGRTRPFTRKAVRASVLAASRQRSRSRKVSA